MDGSVSTAWPPVSPSPPPSRFQGSGKNARSVSMESRKLVRLSLLETGGRAEELERGRGGEWSAGRRGFDRTVLAPSARTVILRALLDSSSSSLSLSSSSSSAIPKAFPKETRGRRRRRRGANFLLFYFILFSLSFSFLPLLSLSLLTVNGGDSR